MIQSNVVIDHIAHFTSQRDQELLSLSLLQSVNNMLSSLSSVILTMDKRGNVLSTIAYDGSKCSVYKADNAIDKGILFACERMSESGIEESNVKSAEGYQVIRAIYHNRKIEQFLVIHLKERFSKVQTYVLSGILNIYNNFLALLNDSQTDELTGLANRKTFDSSISKIFDAPAIQGESIDGERRDINKVTDIHKNYWLAIIDIDNFKQVNDKYGHLYGDEILIHVAQLIKSSFRYEDLQFRFGGEEFVVLIQAESKEQSAAVLERFRRSVENYNFPDNHPVTVSIGAVEFTQNTFHVTSIDYADQALYYSKNNGRNRLTFFEDILCKGQANKQKIDGGEVELF